MISKWLKQAFWHSEGLVLERQMQVQQDMLSAVRLI